MFIASNFKFYLLKTQVPTEQEKGPRPKRRGQEEVGRVWGSQEEGWSSRWNRGCGAAKRKGGVVATGRESTQAAGTAKE